jgi:hypothetical protein
MGSTACTPSTLWAGGAPESSRSSTSIQVRVFTVRRQSCEACFRHLEAPVSESRLMLPPLGGGGHRDGAAESVVARELPVGGQSRCAPSLSSLTRAILAVAKGDWSHRYRRTTAVLLTAAAAVSFPRPRSFPSRLDRARRLWIPAQERSRSEPTSAPSRACCRRKSVPSPRGPLNFLRSQVGRATATSGGSNQLRCPADWRPE